MPVAPRHTSILTMDTQYLHWDTGYTHRNPAAYWGTLWICSSHGPTEQQPQTQQTGGRHYEYALPMVPLSRNQKPSRLAGDIMSMLSPWSHWAGTRNPAALWGTLWVCSPRALWCSNQELATCWGTSWLFSLQGHSVTAQQTAILS